MTNAAVDRPASRLDAEHDGGVIVIDLHPVKYAVGTSLSFIRDNCRKARLVTR